MEQTCSNNCESKNIETQSSCDNIGPSTSKPIEDSHNMKDLTVFDFNSADEVRQTMKAIFTGRDARNQTEDDEEIETLKNAGDHTKVKRLQNQPLKIYDDNVRLTKQKPNLVEEKPVSSKKRKVGSTSKPGRKSKRVKKSTISSIYIGKLSNLAYFRRHRSFDGTDSDSSGFY